jgi:hypothetical protein
VNFNQAMKARIFVSCGQNAQTDEIAIAKRIGQLLESLSYDPYVAGSEQTLRGVKENIFARLSESEYFLFIDFKREALPGGSHRGSLFSHQELSIAAYLDKPLIALQEEGVQLEGVLSFVQGNCMKFSSRDQILPLIADRVSKTWQPDWQNQIRITRDVNQFADALHVHPHFPQGRPVRYFHLEVKNDHLSKSAFNCYAYLEKISGVKTAKAIDLKLVEFKWRGVVFPNVVIPYKSSRELDAFFVYHDSPAQLHLGAFTDSPEHMKLLPAGEYELTFVVHSQNFDVTSSMFKLHVGGGNVNDIQFDPK